MIKRTRSTDAEGFTVVTTVEVLPKVEVSVVNGVRLTKRTFKEGGSILEGDCACLGSTMHTHSREDCPNRLELIRGRSDG